MARDYTTLRGTSRLSTPASSYQELLRLGERGDEAPDDGAVILHVGDLEPTCSDCGVGQLQWAEAGYVPWHRICDRCGSHWDLHPLGGGMGGIGLIPIPETPTCLREEYISAPCPDCSGEPSDWCETCEATGRIQQPHPERTCYAGDPRRCAERAAGGDVTGITLTCACCCHVPPSRRKTVVQPSVWQDGSGWVPIKLTETIVGKATWGDLLSLLRPEHVTAAEQDQSHTLDVPCVPACWARRARFY